MDISKEIEDKSIALILWNTDKVDDARIYLGVLETEEGEYYFANKEKGWKVLLNEEQFSRLKPVPNELKEILLNADYAFDMTVGSLSGQDTDVLMKTGLRWHG